MNKTGTRASLLAVTALAFGLAGCAGMNMDNTTQRHTALGAGIGAVAGALLGGDVTGALIGAGVGGAGGYVWSKQMEQRRVAMEHATVGSGIAVTQTKENELRVTVPSDVSFDFNRADIKPNMRPVLDQLASGLAAQPNTEMRIVGHTDSVGTDAYNDHLSMERAESTRAYLVEHGVSPRQITVAGRGEHEPVADNSTDSGRARNRRVEIYVGERSVASR